ncbi:MAG: PH domain-containing protein [Burkholderiales bacterium]|nr:PH domain-containing protein [Burkholderiales bacterium]
MSGLDHKHFSGPEHGWEPEPGLPERLPAGETLLWQGAPDIGLVAREVFHVRAVAAYFGLLLAWKLIADWHDGATPIEALIATLKIAPLPLIGLAMLFGLAVAVSRTTLYTLTDKRVVMRIGMVLGITYNIPLRQVAAADLRQQAQGAGDICLRLTDGQRIAYPHLWPHARPWRITQPEPALRCLPDASRVATLLGQAWSVVQQRSAAAPARAAATVRPKRGTGDALAGAEPA